MKKKLLLLAAMLGVTFGMEAQTLSVDNNSFVGLKGKDATLSVKVSKGSEALRDVFFNIVIPDGIELKGTPATTADGYTVAYAKVEGSTNKYNVVLYSAPTKESGKQPSTVGADGVNIDFPLNIPADFSGAFWAELTSNTAAGAATYEAVENSATVVKESAMTSTAYTFQVGLLGDVSKDGKVNSTDVSGLLQFIAVSKTPEQLGSFSVVANIAVDDKLNSTDVSGLLQIVAKSSSSVKEEAEFENVSESVEEDGYAD